LPTLPETVKPETGSRKVELDSTTEVLRSNPKPKTRNPKEIRRPKSEAFGLEREIRYSDFGLPSGFASSFLNRIENGFNFTQR
jgi:hypothetical protein